MSFVVVDSKRSLQLAEAYAPNIYQGLGDNQDYLAPLIFHKPEMLAVKLPKVLYPPTLYYLVREDDYHIYVYYMAVHAFDWTLGDTLILSKITNNLYDIGGICIRHKKGTQLCDIATTFHDRIVFSGNICEKNVFIETKRHGILPFKRGYLDRSPNYILYTEYRFCDLSNTKTRQWEQVKQMVSPSKVPMEQADRLWLNTTSHKKGDIYDAPEKLFLQAELKKRI